ncbi:GH92 family glycosyl hydrolase [Virgibacillus siamensis]|uniref:GH92 family glycosyl hydrolase n=1 Tax=Virgibacillus siamensis TaxID=480071 RepID=UPI001FE255ED|nr:GH92 family glycosyl hydrolase [Virgibacillus siamensis]
MKKKRFMKHFSIFLCLVLTVGFIKIPTPQKASAKTDDSDHTQETDFFTSFEKNDPQPDWENTVETTPDGTKMESGIDGNIPYDGIQGDITKLVDEITVSAENPPSEIASKLIDGDNQTKWLAFEPTAWIEMKLSEPETVIKYAFTSGNDAPGRDPKNWTVYGSNNGEDWSKLDERSGENFTERYQRKIYEFENDTAYKYYRIKINANAGDDLTQLAEINLSNGIDVPPPPPSDMKTHTGDGPESSYTGKTNAGWTGMKAFHYAGTHLKEGRAYSYNKVFDVDIEITPETELSYFIHPQLMGEANMDYSSIFVSVDLAFADGTYLSELGAKDQHGIKLNPQAQGKSETLYPNQWNYKVADIGKVAAGKTIERILVAYDNPEGPGLFQGSIDDIKIDGNPKTESYASPVDYVNILRGTNSNGTFSRGNNFPAIAVPHGFNFWTPATDAGSTSWLYSYQQANNEKNLPEIEAFSLSHETSPWMGDRQTFQVMPSSAEQPSANRDERALAFKHKNETAKPHYYSVTFENGIKTEITPTNHAAMFQFTFNDGNSNLIFDNVNNNGGLSLKPDEQAITGYSDVKSGLSAGASRIFIYATFDQKISESGKLTGENRDNVSGYIGFNTTEEDKTVTMKIATSLISVEQAKKNLKQEISPEDTFESLKADAKEKWNEKLSIIEVKGASEQELVTLYSNMYRLFLYPNKAYENTGTSEKPEYKYASPFSKHAGESTPTETGAKIVKGKPYVNNGFWDTYRTTWPAYSLLTPTQAGKMIDGFVQQYKDGGWISRWSSPGYANLMVGTSSDVAFADAYLKGVTNFDVQAFYESALKNAAVVSENEAVGRKGLETSIFDRFTNTQTGEGMSWALDGYINDFAIANMAKALAGQADKGDPDYEQYRTDYKYYRNRAQNYVEMFNPKVDFFMGRKPSGEWRTTPQEFDPREWGGDYTETNAWNMAFHVPQDGQGLANLYGGRNKLADKLDTFFSTPETASHPGHYGGLIHEMREARDVRMGMYGHSNQPSHHIAYMYNYVGQPWKTQEKVREVMSRLYIGSEIGQGYPGDEDNGEMSAWYIFSAAGFYPLQMGKPEYAIGAPYFEKMTIHLENGNDIVIKAPNVSDKNKYVQGLKVNGKSYNKLTISHEMLTKGATLEFEMGQEPSKWGTSENALPSSITPASTDGSSLLPFPLRDLTDHLLEKDKAKTLTSDKSNAAHLFDNTSETDLTLNGDQPWIQFKYKHEMNRAQLYTITTAGNSSQDPRSWELQGSNDGENWTVLDRREDISFKWRKFTKPFLIENPGKYTYYRLSVNENGGASSTSFAEIELLGYGDMGNQFEKVHNVLNEFIKSGDISGPRVKQLTKKLKQARDQYDKEHFPQAIKKLRGFLKHLNKENPGHVSDDAEDQLSADIHALMELILRQTEK